MKTGPHKGRMIIPSDHNAVGRGSESHTFHSDDHGATWQLGGTISPKMNECQVAELVDGRLMMNLRNADSIEETRAVSFSSDGGMTWSAVTRDPVLIEPICQASILRYTTTEYFDRNRILFSNPASASARTNLTVRLSYDEGQSWPVKKILHAGPTAYSCLTVLPDDTIGCLYEAGVSNSYETITFARFSLAWLTDGADNTARRRVKLERTSAGVSISWPEAFSNSVVEFCENFAGSPKWFELGKTPELIDGFWTYNSAMQSPQRFYRLKIPEAVSH
jgi:sialidase-1